VWLVLIDGVVGGERWTDEEGCGDAGASVDDVDGGDAEVCPGLPPWVPRGLPSNVPAPGADEG
jgi:hypothetical protein